MPKKAFVSGCFDLLHSGHVAFFQEAAQYGNLYVALGSDRNVYRLKNRPTINNQAERLYMIKALACVHAVFVAKGSGILDFVEELKEIKPDYFVVNEDGSTPAKRKLCEELGIEYVVLKRKPYAGLEPRSTTALRGVSLMPESIALAGDWFDQPGLSRQAGSAALLLSIHPTLAWTSPTRNAAIELWGGRLPADDPEKLAKVLFGYTNLPGTGAMIGSKSAIGLTHTGLVRADYAGGHLPAKISEVLDDETLNFIESALYLLPLGKPAASNFAPEGVGAAAAQALSARAKAVWQAVLARDMRAFGSSLREEFELQMGLSAQALAEPARELIEASRGHALGWKIAGESLLLVAEQPPAHAERISIRRAGD